jgi:hypothetical protein
VPHVIFEGRGEIDRTFRVTCEDFPTLHRLAQLIKYQSLLILLPGDQPVGMEAGYVEPEVQITKPKDRVEAILELWCVLSRVRFRQKTVHMQFAPDLLDVSQSGSLSLSMSSKMRVDEKQSMSSDVQARSDSTFVAYPTANESCRNIVLVVAENQMMAIPMDEDCDIQTEQSLFDKELIWPRRRRLCITG